MFLTSFKSMKEVTLLFAMSIFISCIQKETSNKNEVNDVLENRAIFEENQEVEKELTTIMGKGVIITNVDGIDVQRVNLWSSASSKKSINCYLTNNEQIKILEDQDPYFLVKSVNKPNCYGYCMKGFVKMED